jgi:hypothetical protein
MLLKPSPRRMRRSASSFCAGASPGFDSDPSAPVALTEKRAAGAFTPRHDLVKREA